MVSKPPKMIFLGGEVARKGLHEGVVVAVLLLSDLTLLVLNGAKLREKSLKGRVHVDLTLVSIILKLVSTDVRSNQLQSLLAGNKKVIRVISEVVNNGLTVIVSKSLVVLKERTHLGSVNRLQLLETLVTVGGTVLTALATLLIKALNITLKTLDVGSGSTSALDQILKNSLALASHLNKVLCLNLERGNLRGISISGLNLNRLGLNGLNGGGSSLLYLLLGSLSGGSSSCGCGSRGGRSSLHCSSWHVL